MTSRGFAAPRAQARVFVRVRMVSVRRRAAVCCARSLGIGWKRRRETHGSDEPTCGSRFLADAGLADRAAEAMSFALWPSLAEGNEKILAKKFLPHGFVFAQSPLIV
jgi:hypothetical protein